MSDSKPQAAPISIIAEPVINALVNLECALAYARDADNQYMNAQSIIGVCKHHALVIRRVLICEKAIAALRDVLESELTSDPTQTTVGT